MKKLASTLILRLNEIRLGLFSLYTMNRYVVDDYKSADDINFTISEESFQIAYIPPEDETADSAVRLLFANGYEVHILFADTDVESDNIDACIQVFVERVVSQEYVIDLGIAKYDYKTLTCIRKQDAPMDLYARLVANIIEILSINDSPAEMIKIRPIQEYIDLTRSVRDTVNKTKDSDVKVSILESALRDHVYTIFSLKIAKFTMRKTRNQSYTITFKLTSNPKDDYVVKGVHQLIASRVKAGNEVLLNLAGGVLVLI